MRPVRVVLAKLPTPVADGFVGHSGATFEQEFLHISVAQRKAIVEPDPMADDFTGKRWFLLRSGSTGGTISAASPEVGLACEGASWQSLCHGLGRMVNDLTIPLSVIPFFAVGDYIVLCWLAPLP